MGTNPSGQGSAGILLWIRSVARPFFWIVNNPTEMNDSPNPAEVPSLPNNCPLPKNRLITFASLAVLGAVLDLWTKQYVFEWRGLPGHSDVRWVINEHLGIQTAVNTGAVFGLGAGQGLLFALLSIVAGIGIVVWLFGFKAAHSLWLTTALGLVGGGIIGNLYDRLGIWWQEGYPIEWKSGVRDWILVRFEGVPFFDPWPNFNVADSLLVVGAGMLLVQSFLADPAAKDHDAANDENE